MRQPEKPASVCQFLTPPPKKIYNLLSPPYSPDLSPPGYFIFPKLNMKLKGVQFLVVAEIQEAVTDEIRKVQTDFRAHFRNCTTAQKPVYKQMEFILKKKCMCLHHVSSIFKKSVLYTLDRIVYTTLIITFDFYNIFVSGVHAHNHV